VPWKKITEIQGGSRAQLWRDLKMKQKTEDEM
jgi:hypothetical protein